MLFRSLYHWFAITGLANISHSDAGAGPFPVLTRARLDGGAEVGPAGPRQEPPSPPTVSRGQPEPYSASWFHLSQQPFWKPSPRNNPGTEGLPLFPRQGQGCELAQLHAGRKRLPAVPCMPPHSVFASTPVVMTTSQYCPLLGHSSWALPSPSASQVRSKPSQ